MTEALAAGGVVENTAAVENTAVENTAVENTAVENTAVESTAAHGIVVGPLADIPIGEGRAYAVAGDQVAVFRLRDGGVRALGAVCPHRGGPIADGTIDRDVVLCPLHAHGFDLRTGCSTTGAPSLTTYLASVDADGNVVVAAA